MQLPNDAPLRLPVRGPAEARRDPDHGAAPAPLPGAGALRPAVRSRRLRGAGAGQDVDFRQIVDRVRAAAPTLRLAVIARRGARGLPVAGRPARPRAAPPRPPISTRSPSTPTTPRVSALGRHHRHPEADPAHPQRLRLQLARLARRCATSGTATPCSTCCRSPTTFRWRARGCKVLFDGRAGGAHPCHARGRGLPADRAAQRIRTSTSARAADPLAGRSGDPRLRPLLGPRHQERRPEAPGRGEAPRRGADPVVQGAGGLRHGRGPADVRALRRPRRGALETVGRPICPDDEIRLVDDQGHDVPPARSGELLAGGPYTLRGYFRAPEHNAAPSPPTASTGRVTSCGATPPATTSSRAARRT